MRHSLPRRLLAEFLGTFWLVFGGCGSAVISAGFPQLGIGFLGVALAFGLTVLTGAYAFGPVSGGHFNPAVTLGVATAGRFSWKDVGPFWVVQLLGATFAAFVLLKIAQGNIDFSLANGFAANGYDEHSPNWLHMAVWPSCGNRADGLFPACHSGNDRRSRAGRLRANRHRIGADADPSGRHPHHQRFGEPCALDEPGALRRRLGPRTTLAVLGRAARRRRHRGAHSSLCPC